MTSLNRLKGNLYRNFLVSS